MTEPVTDAATNTEIDITLRHAGFTNAAPDGRRTHFRSQLNLPADRPVIMGGHQASLWHPGILAKWFTTTTLATQHHAASAWLTVDQDTNDPGAISLPINQDQRWQRTDTTLTPKPSPPGTPTAHRPAFQAKAPDTTGLPADLASRLNHAIQTLDKHADAPSAAEQLTRTISDLLDTHAMHHTSATALASTDLYQSLLADVKADPDACRESLNAAIDAHPKSGLKKLRPDALPFWITTDTGPRAAATINDLDHPRPLPKGLLMTLLARLAACDLFIHGTGGETYEPAADEWLRRWNPPSLAGLTPAPYTIATADLHLPLTSHAVPTKQQLAHAQWLAHRAQHDPSLAGDDQAQQTKRKLAEQIESLPRHSKERLTLYREMQQQLDQHRKQHADAIANYEQDAQQQALAFRDRAVLTARDWPFFLYPPAQLEQLRDQIQAQLTREPAS